VHSTDAEQCLIIVADWSEQQCKKVPEDEPLVKPVKMGYIRGNCITPVKKKSASNEDNKE
jgi:hypothetical protein